MIEIRDQQLRLLVLAHLVRELQKSVDGSRPAPAGMTEQQYAGFRSLSPGDLVGFMVVAGSTRSDNNVAVRERSAVVLVPFPRDGLETSFPPFAWQA